MQIFLKFCFWRRGGVKLNSGAEGGQTFKNRERWEKPNINWLVVILWIKTHEIKIFQRWKTIKRSGGGKLYQFPYSPAVRGENRIGTLGSSVNLVVHTGFLSECIDFLYEIWGKVLGWEKNLSGWHGKKLESSR